jgi:hypothetical protein
MIRMRVHPRPAVAAVITALIAGATTLFLGSASLASPAPAAAQPARLDHFKCYTARARAAVHPTQVRLRDEFGVTPAVVARQPDRLCNPVKKTLPTGAVTNIRNPRAHLLCYPIRAAAQPHEVRVQNQFGQARLTVGAAQRLCLPSWKLRTAQFPQPTQPPGLDHFTCYAARYSTVQVAHFRLPATLGLSDQFEQVRARLGAPVELCNPVEKTVPGGTVTPIRNPNAHLVCFPIRQQPAHVPQSVFTKNQFGQTALTTVVQSRLCVPSLKQLVTS